MGAAHEGLAFRGNMPPSASIISEKSWVQTEEWLRPSLRILPVTYRVLAGTSAHLTGEEREHEQAHLAGGGPCTRRREQGGRRGAG